MTVLDPITYGTRVVLDLDGLIGADGNPSAFGASDVLRFTMKRGLYQSDAKALIHKTSTDGGITFSAGADNAEVVIEATDWPAPLGANVSAVWDVIVALGGDPDQVVSLDSGTVRLKSRVSLSIP